MRAKCRPDLRRDCSKDRNHRRIRPGDTTYVFDISQRELEGLYILRYNLCDGITYGRTLRPLFDRIGGGVFTLVPEPDLVLASQISRDRIEASTQQAQEILGVAEFGSFLSTDRIEPDKVAHTTLIYSELAHAGMKALAKTLKRQHQQLGITSVAGLFRAIGAGAVKIVPVVNEQLRMNYLSSMPEIKEYLELEATIAERSRQAAAAM